MADRPGEPVTTIWLARHGEVHNPDRILYGRLPRMGLSGEGLRQAEAQGVFLAGRPLARIYSSPLLRARQTARRIQERHPAVPISISRDLLEIRSGWEGTPSRHLDRLGWNYYDNPHSEGDERIAEIRDRMQRWVRRCLRQHPRHEVVGISHGDPILILLADLQGRPLEAAQIRPRPYMSTGTIFRLRFDARERIVDTRAFVPHRDLAR